MSTGPWDPDEYDRAIKAARSRELAERAMKGRVTQRGVRGATTVNPAGQERGVLTDEQMKRRKATERAMQRRARRNGEG